ncbi:MAG: hypothetical protein EZS28_033745 [Streblomastix strix]|uniref:Uncharacterized protein n=1 Tax=Streblomastix strix TaxID=222440 RepID=A0A5J4UJH2_9EUKA|nr:MAG: hypothetical protein EZS28_033745 [Streblomastix strix]
MLRQVLYKSQRNKKNQFFSKVLKIREVSASWAGGESFPHDPALQGKEDREFTPAAIGVKCAHFIEGDKAFEDIIQFPIESSLSWILTTHTLNYLPSETDTLLAIFDLYSAAADTALRELKSRYLFDKIESEAKLGMQQVLFILRNNIYSYYKKLASAKLVETSYREVFDSIPRVVKGNAEEQLPARQQS